MKSRFLVPRLNYNTIKLIRNQIIVYRSSIWLQFPPNICNLQRWNSSHPYSLYRWLFYYSSPCWRIIEMMWRRDAPPRNVIRKNRPGQEIAKTAILLWPVHFVTSLQVWKMRSILKQPFRIFNKFLWSTTTGWHSIHPIAGIPPNSLSSDPINNYYFN